MDKHPEKQRNCCDCTKEFITTGTTTKRCIPCRRIEKHRQDKKYRLSHKEEINDYWRKNKEKKRLKDLRYSMRLAIRGEVRVSKVYPRKINPPFYKSKARSLINEAIRWGKVKRGKCKRCGTNKNVDAHHKDYSKPLEVEWYCRSCHFFLFHSPSYQELRSKLPKELVEQYEAVR